ncbi:MAG: hypothetical protein JW892_02370 [Anaerolineae bacterium]|nr:hypothetical protein [Anaerolineae bacterium]
MSNTPILMPQHPETGQAQREARSSLFTLLVITVALGAILNAIINLLGTPEPANWHWWAWLSGLFMGGGALVYSGIRYDDCRIGRAEIPIEILLPYLIDSHGRVTMGKRSSYMVTGVAQEAWKAVYRESGLQLQPGDVKRFKQAIAPPHFDLLRYLLVHRMGRYGRERTPESAGHSWLRLSVPLSQWKWARLPPRLRDNPFAAATGNACPKHLNLPAGAGLTADLEGDCLLRVTWRWRRWLPWGPRGEIRIRWLGPLSDVDSKDKRYELLTARLLEESRRCCVVITRIMVEVDTRWNFLANVAGFRDWGLNLAHRLTQQMDYYAWWEYLLQRTLVDLDWKIGWIEKGEDLSLVKRLQRLDDRLGRLEAHLWPNEPPTGAVLEEESGGAWLSAVASPTDAARDEADAETVS